MPIFLRKKCPLTSFMNDPLKKYQIMLTKIIFFSGGKRCGQRAFTPITGGKPGEASPDEFPWTCLILTGNNDFVGGCAIVPDSIQNDISQGTRRVITVAHKLAKLKKNE